MDRDWPGVFVSSTCYDLIDLRAELEPFLRELGFAPILSDRPSSDFETTGDKDSITTCLVNVRKCPIFICVLSQRYGPRLKSVGFEDVSATHLEYRAARDAGARVFFYVRDRLESEYTLWKANRGTGTTPSFRWVRDPKDHGLFELISEHDELKKDGPSNWRWDFRNSIELKGRIASDLGEQSRKLRLRRLIQEGAAPLVTIKSPPLSSGSHGLSFAFVAANIGAVAGLDVRMRFGDGEWRRLGDVAPSGWLPGQSLNETNRSPFSKDIGLRYSTPTGEIIEDTYLLEFTNPDRYTFSLKRRALLDARSFEVG